MDCNLAEALQEKEIVETMIVSGDYMDARDKLLRASQLYPALENISQMLTVCDILCASDFQFPTCGTDWYWVLQINASADDSRINSQYQRLTTLLEPMKDKFPGTVFALEVLQNAFSVLSDREKRLQFDSERNASRRANGSMGSQKPCDLGIINKEKAASSQNSYGTKRVSCEISNGSNGEGCSGEVLKRIKELNKDDHVTNTMALTAETSTRAMVSNGNCVTDKKKKKTICAQEAIQIDSPLGGGDPYESPSNPMKHTAFYNFDNNRKFEVFSVGQVWAAYDEGNTPRRYGYVSSICNLSSKLYVRWLKPDPVTVDEKSWFMAGLPVACGPFELPDHSITRAEPTVFSHLISRASVSSKSIEIYPKKGEVWGVYRDWKPFDWCSDPRKMKGCRLQMVEILTDYVKQVGVGVGKLVKVEGFRSVFQRYTSNGKKSSILIPAKDLFMFSHNIPIFRFVGREMIGVLEGMFELDPLALRNDFFHGMAKTVEEGSSIECSSFTNNLPTAAIEEPDIEILEPKWSAEDFSLGQIWAVYDDGPDSMPRRYAIVGNVISGSEVCVTILEPQPMVDDDIYCIEGYLPFSCGLFRAGRTTLNLSMSIFSHFVNCEPGTKTTFYHIYPKKGEIWAMYRNWNKKWNCSDYNDSEYWVVEVISDFSEEGDMRVARLMMVNGYMTFFQRQLCDGFELTKAISRREILSFSHQIPAFTVPGVEHHGIPKDSFHVDPNALPPKLATDSHQSS